MIPEFIQGLIVGYQLVVNVCQVKSNFYVHVRKGTSHLSNVFENYVMTLHRTIEGTDNEIDKAELQKEIQHRISL
jgi:hypothetical protein